MTGCVHGRTRCKQYEQSPTKEWYKEYVTDFSIHIKADASRDDELFAIYQTFLEAYLDMAKNAQVLPDRSARQGEGRHGKIC